MCGGGETLYHPRWTEGRGKGRTGRKGRSGEARWELPGALGGWFLSDFSSGAPPPTTRAQLLLHIPLTSWPSPRSRPDSAPGNFPRPVCGGWRGLPPCKDLGFIYFSGPAVSLASHIALPLLPAPLAHGPGPEARTEWLSGLHLAPGQLSCLPHWQSLGA